MYFSWLKSIYTEGNMIGIANVLHHLMMMFRDYFDFSVSKQV